MKPTTFALSGVTGDSMYYELWYFQQGISIQYQNIIADISGIIETSQNVFDILSGLIEFRINVLNHWTVANVLDTLYIPLVKSTEVIQIPVIYKGAGTVTLNGSNVETMIFLVMLNSLCQQLFGADADLLIYFSVEDHHLPLRMETDLILGPLKIGRIIGLIDLDHSKLPYSFP